jgi:hypothetical protein
MRGAARQGHGRHPRGREGRGCLRRLRLRSTSGSGRTGRGHRPHRGVPRKRGQRLHHRASDRDRRGNGSGLSAVTQCLGVPESCGSLVSRSLVGKWVAMTSLRWRPARVSRACPWESVCGPQGKRRRSRRASWLAESTCHRGSSPRWSYAEMVRARRRRVDYISALNRVYNGDLVARRPIPRREP